MATHKDSKDKDLLRDKKAIEEINRHLWIESEKAGYDIGFDRAAVDWLENFSKAWMSYHTPKKTSTASKKTTSASKRSTSSKQTQKSRKKS